jgi:hypothetical protein
LGFGVWRLRVYSLKFGIQSSGFRAQVSGCRVVGLSFMLYTLGFRVQSERFRIQGLGFVLRFFESLFSALRV